MRNKLTPLLLMLAAPSCCLANTVENFIFIGGDSDNLAKYAALLADKNISGFQIIYTWKQLEPSNGQYNFSLIESNLEYLEHYHKKLFIQVQDRFFEPQAKNIPLYLQIEPEYHGGLAMQLDKPGANRNIASGWVAMQWNNAVRERFQLLLKNLAEKFDGRIYGINLPETAIDLATQDKDTKFSCDKYFDATMSTMLSMRSYFKQSYTVQYVNFFPCEWNNNHNYMSSLFATAITHHIGLGGPDTVPNKKSHLQNSYPYFHKNIGKLSLTAMAVQEPDYTYINPDTGKHYTNAEFSKYAREYLGANIIFWQYDKFYLK